MSRPVAFGFMAALVVLVAFYALGAFIAWDANPGNWGDFMRGMVGPLALICSVLGGAITASETA